MQTFQPKVSVIVPTYRNWQGIEKCLSCLLNQTYPAESLEIIVVNNDPVDKCPIESLPRHVQIIDEDKPGSYAARNAGILRASGSFIAFTDSDCLPAKDWIEKGVGFLINNKEVFRVGGRIELIFKSKNLSLAEVYEKAFAFRQKDYVSRQGMAATANMIARAVVFEKIGPFRDDLMSGGDAEWGRRARDQGYPIQYVEDCIVYHPARSNFSDVIRKYRREAGGHVMTSSSRVKAGFEAFLCLLPPVRSAWPVIIRKDLTSKEKIFSIFLRYFLRLVGAKERLLLLLSAKSPERC